MFSNSYNPQGVIMKKVLELESEPQKVLNRRKLVTSYA